MAFTPRFSSVRYYTFLTFVCVCMLSPLGVASMSDDGEVDPLLEPDTANICLDYGQPTILQCSCDPNEYDVKTVHCTLAGKITPGHSLWNSLRSNNVHLESFTVKAREPEFLMELPLGVIRDSPHLEEFTVQRTGVTKIPGHAFRNSSSLKQIDLDANEIAQLSPYAVANLPLLEVLSLNENQLELLRRNALQRLPQLKELYMVSNKIMRMEDGTFAELPALLTLDLARNKLGPELRSAVFTGLSRLISLDLGENHLRRLGPVNFVHLAGLQTLILRGNRLTSIDPRAFDGLGRLLKLHLSKNELLRFHDNTLRPLPRLVYLDLSSNNLTTLTEASLKPLDPRNNNATYVSLAGNQFICDCRLRWMLDLVKLRNDFHLNPWSSVKCTVPRGINDTAAGFEHDEDGALPADDSMVRTDGERQSGNALPLSDTVAVKYIDVERCSAQLYAQQEERAPTLRLSGASKNEAVASSSCKVISLLALAVLVAIW